MFISANDISLKFQNTSIFDSTSFDIEQGKMTAIIGANGAGKTSLLKLILKNFSPTTGTLKINSGTISYVSQHFNNTELTYLTPFDMIKLGLNGNTFGISKITKDQKNEIYKIAEKFHIEHRLFERMSNLSGGEIQKTAICQALINNPDTLLLDEPFSSLDIRSIKEIVEILDDIKNLGINILIVIHDINPILHIVDGCIYFVDGHGHYMQIENQNDKEKLAHIYSNLSVVHHDNKSAHLDLGGHK